MTAPNDIVIDDLADPRITPAIAAAREGPADFPADIDVDGVLARARGKGSDALGEMRFLAGVALGAWRDSGIRRLPEPAPCRRRAWLHLHATSNA